MEWDIPEQSLWDLVPQWEREPDHAFVHLLAWRDPRYQYWIPGACSRPWCDPCERQRLGRYRNRIEKYISYHEDRGLSKWWFLTRSIRNSHNPWAAFNEFIAVRKLFQAHVFRDTHPFHLVRAWVAMSEMTYSMRTGYNLHQHMLLGTKKWSDLNKEDLHGEWTKAAGRTSMSHLKRMHNRVGAVAYVTKYISKGSWGGISRGRVYLIRDELKGRNRIQFMPRTLPPKDPPSGFMLCCIPFHRGACQRDAEDRDIRPGWDYHGGSYGDD